MVVFVCVRLATWVSGSEVCLDFINGGENAYP